MIDSSALTPLINPAATPPEDPATGQLLHRARERVEHFIQGLTADDTLIIGTPVLAEVLVRAEDGGPGVLEAIGGLARVRVRPFGERAAVETAVMTREAIAAGDKKLGSAAPYQKVKVDQQVVAIARAEGATRLYTDDTISSVSPSVSDWTCSARGTCRCHHRKNSTCSLSLTKPTRFLQNSLRRPAPGRCRQST